MRQMNLAKNTTVHIKLANGLLIEFYFSLIRKLFRDDQFSVSIKTFLHRNAYNIIVFFFNIYKKTSC